MLWNGILIAAIGVGTLVGLGLRLRSKGSKAATASAGKPQDWTWEKLDAAVKQYFITWTSDILMDVHANEEEFRRETARRLALKKALKACNNGEPAAKEYIKEWIVDIVEQHIKLAADELERLISFNSPALLTVQDKFDLLLYAYKQRYGYEALDELIRTYKWDELKVTPSAEDESGYVVMSGDVDVAFRLECLQFAHRDRIRIVAQRLYQRYKGFSVIDEMRDMRIDGVSGGINGVPEVLAGTPHAALVQPESGDKEEIRACDSVWIFYKGKSIRFAFLSFGSDAELRRVCHNIYKYQSPGPLTEADGYRVNHMKDGSRVVVLRPPFAESWCFFIRKFDTSRVTLSQLITDKNADLPIALLTYLMKGARMTAVTGAQGSGKTTLLMALVQSIYPFYPLRVQEQAFELHLRRLYPHRNIVSLRETERISGQAGLDVQKKTDGTVHILGEVATDPVAAWMIQMAQVASLFTVFTHHAKTFPDLIFALRNSLLKSGMFYNEAIAEQQVSSVIHFDVHLARDADGKRYIERITECIPMADPEPGVMPAAAESGGGGVSWERYILSSEQLHRRLSRTRAFEYRNIVEYRQGRYCLVHPLSDRQAEAMEREMTAEDKRRFRKWLTDEGGMANAG
ncbi:ATPase, T2SS/T4P/T4SS family [Paenibacillus thiaminolyticus]|uniref:Pilus assembly protein CpaF n=1 Tax=Paenibacillus thiaminolyticus TaxID=49283 RepID=A0A3A3GJ06_PANTH|nr:ATPase, T2SS/T4P/T4SS family [Paenibacillus thiaminolyticus]RJG24627.1 pilus assembly protein CpaF [Paenibacillus thiaminolyticus]